MWILQSLKYFYYTIKVKPPFGTEGSLARELAKFSNLPESVSTAHSKSFTRKPLQSWEREGVGATRSYVYLVDGVLTQRNPNAFRLSLECSSWSSRFGSELKRNFDSFLSSLSKPLAYHLFISLFIFTIPGIFVTMLSSIISSWRSGGSLVCDLLV